MQLVCWSRRKDAGELSEARGWGSWSRVLNSAGTGWFGGERIQPGSEACRGQTGEWNLCGWSVLLIFGSHSWWFLDFPPGNVSEFLLKQCVLILKTGSVVSEVMVLV